MVRCRFLELLPSEPGASTAGGADGTGVPCDADAAASDGESLIASEGTVLAAWLSRAMECGCSFMVAGGPRDRCLSARSCIMSRIACE